MKTGMLTDFSPDWSRLDRFGKFPGDSALTVPDIPAELSSLPGVLLPSDYTSPLPSRFCRYPSLIQSNK